MKKISILMALLAAFALTFVTTGCKDGEDGEDAEALILRQTAGFWFQYIDSSTSSVTGTSGTTNETLADFYIKYDKSSEKVTLAACSTNYYATTEKDLSKTKWNVGIIALKGAGKVKKQTSDPTSGKLLLTVSNWGNMTLDNLIETFFE